MADGSLDDGIGVGLNDVGTLVDGLADVGLAVVGLDVGI